MIRLLTHCIKHGIVTKPCAACATATRARKRAHTDRRHRPFRIRILERDGYRCHWCGHYANTIDYLTPLAQGGQPHDPANAVAACQTCNSRRGQTQHIDA